MGFGQRVHDGMVDAAALNLPHRVLLGTGANSEGDIYPLGVREPSLNQRSTVSSSGNACASASQAGGSMLESATASRTRGELTTGGRGFEYGTGACMTKSIVR